MYLKNKIYASQSGSLNELCHRIIIIIEWHQEPPEMLQNASSRGLIKNRPVLHLFPQQMYLFHFRCRTLQ